MLILWFLTILTFSNARQPETRPRPSRRGFSALSGICDRSQSSETYSGIDGTFKACSERCLNSIDCIGFNYFIDLNQCSIFDQECSTFVPVDRNEPRQNFYIKGEIACATSTVGNDFVIAFMANRVAQPKNMSLEIWLTQDFNVSTSTVHLETDPSMGVEKTIRIPYKNAVYALIPHSFKVSYVDSGITIEKKAMILHSDDDFVLYGVNKEFFTADAFLGIPNRALGTRYIANCHWPPFYNCEFAMTPVENETEIVITLPVKPTLNTGNWAYPPPTSIGCNIEYGGRNYTSGQSIVVKLDRFDVLQVQNPCDLTGTIVESNKPIAFWSGNARVNVGDSPSRDHQVEELFSVDTWGTDCAAWPTPNRPRGLVDYWVITAAYDNTRIRVDSFEKDVNFFDLNAGESVRFPAVSVTEWQRFSSDKRFQAVKYSSSAQDNTVPGDPAMTVCIPSDQFGFGYTFVTPKGVSSPYINYMTLITHQGSEDGFLLDGNQIIGLNWESVPNSGLVGAFVQLDPSKQQFRIDHRVRGTRFEAYIYGAGDRESIAYPTGACIQALGECQRNRMVISDGKDNDCDGVVDEELFDGKDNDFDGEVDEDCYEREMVPIMPIQPLMTTTQRQVVRDRCPVTHNANACIDDMLELSCRNDQETIKIIEGHFGRIGLPGEMTCGGRCDFGKEDNCPWRDISSTAKMHCDGETQCSLPVQQFWSEDDLECPKSLLYANVQYVCLTEKERSFVNGITEPLRRKASSWHQPEDIAHVCLGKGKKKIFYQPNEDFTPENSEFGVGAMEGWRPADCDDRSAWLEIDLGAPYHVGSYAISGCRQLQQWVTSFGISYSTDGIQWTIVQNRFGGFKKFEGNSDSVTVKFCTLFEYEIFARYVRVHVFDFPDRSKPCLHIGFGHDKEIKSCSITSVAHSNLVNGGTTGYDSAVSVVCDPGWSTDDGELAYLVRCKNDGQWSTPFPPCNKLLYCPGIFLNCTKTN